ncbi:MAG: hypothetical protein COU40_00720 [Candidatus Moranbacteria bacterium CG10_big_fil_rev_8_21_14_0_10_35_21]|nr:MAG: hypothetical protein COU40_00720 [Candidatus Moranbacteria bacterium CG10_big_fil_rev_8_21_14_0_10_35_21]PJA88957.1 MAG: hypothetical protein CO139_00385 [Candidatus Moranbacteria bacterium CG_4_9_14_3_um_filter_36_9]
MLIPSDFSSPETIAYIKTIGYPTMFLLMIVEGPIATVIAAFFSKLGFFNIYLVFILSFLGDIIGDIILYFIGYYGGFKTLKKAEKILKTKPKIIIKLENHFRIHGRKTIIAVKSTTGLCWITFILAGATKMPFKTFLTSSVVGGIVWSSFLVLCGYFFGYAFRTIDLYIKYAGIIIFIVATIFFVGLTFYKKYQAQKILQINTGNL